MATYKGHDIPQSDQSDEDLKRLGGRVRGLDNAEEELNLPPAAGTERVRRPGEKGYLDSKPQAGDDMDWWLKKMRGIMSDAPTISKMKAGDSWVAPSTPIGRASAKFVDEAEQVRPKGIALHAKGGMVTKHGSSTRVTCRSK